MTMHAKKSILLKDKMARVYGKIGGIFLAFFLLFAIMSIVSPYFLTAVNIASLLKQAVTNGFMAFGIAYCLISGEIDLSVGAVYAFAGVMACSMVNQGIPYGIAILLSLALCVLVGVINGIVTIQFKLPSFIVTLAMQSVVRGTAYLLGGSLVVKTSNPGFSQFGKGTILGISNSVYIMIIVGIIMAVILTKTIFGRHVMATGGNKETALYSGIKVSRVKIICFAICSLLAGIAGVMAAARISQALASNGAGMEGDAIAAAVLGGVSFSGGRGSIVGALFGALTLALLSNGMYMLGVSYYIQLVVQGLLIVLAVIIDQRKSLRQLS